MAHGPSHQDSRSPCGSTTGGQMTPTQNPKERDEMPDYPGNGGPHDMLDGPCSCGSWHSGPKFVVNGTDQPMNVWASALLSEISICALRNAKYEPELERWEARDTDGNVFPWSMPMREIIGTIFLC